MVLMAADVPVSGKRPSIHKAQVELEWSLMLQYLRQGMLRFSRKEPFCPKLASEMESVAMRAMDFQTVQSNAVALKVISNLLPGLQIRFL